MIDYSWGVTLYLWDRGSWDRFRRTQLGRLVWSRCAKAHHLRMRTGRAVIYSGYASLPRRGCPARAFDRLLAHVYLGGIVIAINMPHCYMCVPRGKSSVDPYNSRRGMEAVVRGLTVRRPRR